MIKDLISTILIITIFSFTGYSQQKTLNYKVKNPNNFSVKDGYLTLKFDTPEDNFIIADGDKSLTYQIKTFKSG